MYEYSCLCAPNTEFENTKREAKKKRPEDVLAHDGREEPEAGEHEETVESERDRQEVEHPLRRETARQRAERPRQHQQRVRHDAVPKQTPAGADA